MKWLKKYFPIIYVALSIIVFLYVRNALKQDIIVVNKITNDKKVVKEIRPVDVSLTISGFKQNATYSLRKESDETFDDFLEDLVDHSGFMYEKTEYTYGTVYDKINGEIAPEGYVWKVFADEEEFTYNTKGLKLIDKTAYRLLLDTKPLLDNTK